MKSLFFVVLHTKITKFIMKKSIFLSFLLLLIFTGLGAQNGDYLYGTDMLCPTGAVKLTEAPKGFEPFYISHYGRHGARYAWQSDIYEMFNETLTKAEKHGNLTPVGKELKAKFDLLYPEVRYRVGELSSVGWYQQKALAERAFENFPTVWEGDAKVTAYTSTSTRCVMTMSSFCLGLKGKNPKMEIFENFGYKFLPAILPLSSGNPFKDDNYRRVPLLFDETWEEYIERKVDYIKILSRLFVDPDKAVAPEQRWHTVSYLYFLVNGMNSLENAPDLTFVFTEKERIALWEIDNFQFYAQAWPTHYGYMPIVKDIIDKTDDMIASGKHGADLRFGHDYTILPLLMILGVEGMDHNCVNGDEITTWCKTNQVPMGANVQLVFYRSKSSDDILFKVLFNGKEAHLPLETSNWPYYSWESFKKYFGEEIAANNNTTKVGPWVTNVTDNSLTILWTTSTASMGWVETPDGKKYYETFAGRRTFGTLHRVNISGLQSGATFKYRIGGNPLLDDSKPRKPKFGKSWNGTWHEVALFDKGGSIAFSVLNDIHSKAKEYKTLLSQINTDSTDFIFLNGDMAQTGNYDLDKLAATIITPLGEMAAEMPIMFARGNHEGRGVGIRNVATIFPNKDSESFYYTFRQGPAAIVVFDAGETGEDRSIAFSGTPVYEDYLNEQIEWAKRVLFEKEFAEAPLKICFIHVPMIDHKVKDDYKIQRWLNRNFLPILNQAGIDVMIGADLHEHMECLPGSMGNDFPIIVNEDVKRLDFKAADGTMTVKCFDTKGKQTYSKSFKY